MDKDLIRSKIGQYVAAQEHLAAAVSDVTLANSRHDAANLARNAANLARNAARDELARAMLGDDDKSCRVAMGGSVYVATRVGKLFAMSVEEITVL